MDLTKLAEKAYSLANDSGYSYEEKQDKIEWLFHEAATAERIVTLGLCKHYLMQPLGPHWARHAGMSYVMDRINFEMRRASSPGFWRPGGKPVDSYVEGLA